MKMRSWNKMVVTALAAFGVTVAMAGNTGRVQAASPNTAPPTSTIASARADLPPVPAEVLRMSEAGLSDDVITAYLQKSAYAYTLDAGQIIYLHDMGVSTAVLDALVTHGGMAANAQAAAADEAANTDNASPTETPLVNGTATNFYNSLAPYGTWVNVPAYGWCWQPTVVVVDPAWQPYCNNGCWLWTDQGWYWNSYYSWGWAPFHYGRWCQSPGYGWVWCPDNTWGPAWVCWRDYPGFCGWAPLPPGACFTAGVGWTFNGLAVGFNFGFGLGPRCFTFCDFDDFCHRHPFEHFRHGRDADRFFHDSRVNNDFALDAHHRFFNRGIDPSRIEAATHTRLQPVAVREMPHRDGRSGDFGMPDRLTRSGNDPVVYRPGQDLSGARNHFLPVRHTPSVNHWGGDTATRGFNAGRDVGNTPRVQPGRPNDYRSSMPGGSWNHSNPDRFNPNRGGAGNSQVRSYSPAPGYHRNYADSQRFAPVPAWHPAPAWHSAPSRSWGGGTQNGGGTHSWGGGSQTGGGMSSGHGFHR
ncbi:MAG TPA: DUF6600 domain-containing protein [Verrucomicrobiae bacterium]|nr:DUF6600 domain-containing protein [Verrucomicrobiae bacterium]